MVVVLAATLYPIVLMLHKFWWRRLSACRCLVLDPHVPGETTLPTVPEGAKGALKWLLPSVGAHVLGETALLTAPVGADGALERLLPSVGAHVLGETALHTAPVGAEGALERLLPSVGAHVPGEIALTLEPLGTHLALQLPRAAIFTALPLRHRAPLSFTAT